jgi:hypothetical protein
MLAIITTASVAACCAVVSYGILLAWRRTKKDLCISRKQYREGGR